MNKFGPFKLGSLSITLMPTGLASQGGQLVVRIHGNDIDAIETMSADKLEEFCTQARIVACAARQASERNRRRAERLSQLAPSTEPRPT